MRHRVPSGPVPVLASDFHQASQPQQTTQAKPADSLHGSAPIVESHGQPRRQYIAAAPSLQASKPAALSVAPAQQHKQETDSDVKPPTAEAPEVTGYASNARKFCLLQEALLCT